MTINLIHMDITIEAVSGPFTEVIAIMCWKTLTTFAKPGVLLKYFNSCCQGKTEAAELVQCSNKPASTLPGQSKQRRFAGALNSLLSL